MAALSDLDTGPRVPRELPEITIVVSMHALYNETDMIKVDDLDLTLLNASAINSSNMIREDDTQKFKTVYDMYRPSPYISLAEYMQIFGSQFKGAALESSISGDYDQDYVRRTGWSMYRGMPDIPNILFQFDDKFEGITVIGHTKGPLQIGQKLFVHEQQTKKNIYLADILRELRILEYKKIFIINLGCGTLLGETEREERFIARNINRDLSAYEIRAPPKKYFLKYTGKGGRKSKKYRRRTYKRNRKTRKLGKP